MSTTIEDRLRLLLTAESGGRPETIEDSSDEDWSTPQFAIRGFWKWLGEVSNISSPRWRAFFAGRQKPTPAMIEAACRLWPEHAFWLATGITDATNGHIAPVTAMTFPERLYVSDESSNRYFKASLRLADDIDQILNSRARQGGKTQANKETIQLLGRWQQYGNIAEIARDLTKSEAYERLIQLWKHREAERPRHVARAIGKDRPWEKSKHQRSDSSIPMTSRELSEKHDLFWKFISE